MCALLAGALAAGLVAYELTLPHVLVGVATYDEGVYLAATLRLLHGALPYRDFAFLQPPGLPLLLSPLTALLQVGGDRAAMAGATILTGAVAAGDVVLAAWLLRSRGPVAVLTGGLLAAALPAAVTADVELQLEPYLALFCLLGALALFDREGSLASGSRRIALGGMALGLACAVKVWALAPLLVVVVVYAGARAGRRRISALVGGIALGAGVPSLPFFALAPAAFVHDVVVTQLTRAAEAGAAVPVLQRLSVVTGVWELPGLHSSVVAPVAALGVVGVLAAIALVPPGRRPVDWFLVGSTVAVVAAVSASKEFYGLYGYFPGLFVAMTAGVGAGRLVPLAKAAVRATRRALRLTLLVTGSALAAAGVALLALLVPGDAAYARSYQSAAADHGAELALRIARGACVVADWPALPISADRLPGSLRCPVIVDPFGQWLADDPAHPPPYAGPYASALVGQWMRALRRADYLVEVAPQSDFVPWAPQLTAYLQSRFVLVYSAPGVVLYERTSALYGP